MTSIDVTVLEQIRLLLEDNFDTLIDTYISDNTMRVQSLGIAVDMQKWTKVKEISHTMKSSSANIGALQLAEICQLIENDSGNNIQSVKQNYARLLTEFDAVLRCLQSFR